MLSFQVINSTQEIRIYCDDQGMATLVRALEEIRPDGGHVHLRTRANGGRELDEQTPWGDVASGEVVITWVGD